MLQLILFLGFGTWMAAMARKKGYMPMLWFFAAGLIGLFVLSTLPDTTKSIWSEQQRAEKVRTGNIVGGCISGFAILITAAMIGSV